MKQNELDSAMAESLSALMDGETDELSLRRILKADVKEVNATWSRYHAAQSAMHGQLNEFAQVDLSSSISAAIAQEETHRQVPGSKPIPQWLKPVAGFAVAASVAAIVVVSGNGFIGSEINEKQIAAASGSAAVSSGPVFPVAANNRRISGAQTVGLTASSSGQAEYVITTSDPEVQAEFERYVRAHAERAALNSGPGSWSYARWTEAKADKQSVDKPHSTHAGNSAR